MRSPVLRIVLVGLLAVAGSLASPRAAGADPGPALFACQRTILGASGRWVRARHTALARCFAKALRCPGGLGGDATSETDACLARVGAGCARLLAKAQRAAAGVDQAGLSCTLGGPRRIAPADLLTTDGLGLEQLAPLCPETRSVVEDAESASRCQRLALTCAIDASVALAMPRAAELLSRLGVPHGVGARCLLASLCGNGILDGEEECDAGPANSDTTPDACRTTCLEPWCGDGVVDEDEECDDGNVQSGDGCDEDCFLEEGGACGDGVLDPDEECDDGNLRPGDGCDEDCFLEEGGACGDGVLDPDEECDDGNLQPGDGCDEDCFLEEGAACGDGAVDPDEECDDGPLNSDLLPDRCRTDCSEPWCGDGVVDPSNDELCEPPGSLLCDDDCLPRLLGFLSRPAPAQPAACQLAINAGARRTFLATRGGATRCIARVARCVLGIDEDRDPDGDRFDRCVERADRRCAAIAAKLDRVRATAAARASDACAAVPLADMLNGEHGLGFESMASECPVPAGETPRPAHVVACALARARCEGERAVMDSAPRGYDLLTELLEVDGEEAFPCIVDPEDLSDF